jgi:hypothetical protein
MIALELLMTLLGIDGCKAGWFVAEADAELACGICSPPSRTRHGRQLRERRAVVRLRRAIAAIGRTIFGSSQRRRLGDDARDLGGRLGED